MTAVNPFLTSDQIRYKVVVLADRISKDYEGTEIVAVGILKGAFLFFAELVRSINVPVTVDFIHSYSAACCGHLVSSGPGRRSSKSGDPLVKCRVNTLYAKCEEGESEATCRPSLLGLQVIFETPPAVRSILL